MADSATRDAVSLDDVRARFLHAEEQMRQAAQSLRDLESAVDSLGGAADGLRAAGAEVGKLRSGVEAAVATLQSGVKTLQGGVDALRASEPATIALRVQQVREEIGKDVASLHDSLRAGVAGLTSGIERTNGAIAGGVEESKRVSERGAAQLAELVTGLRSSSTKSLAALDARVGELQAHLRTAMEARAVGEARARALQFFTVAVIIVVGALLAGLKYLMVR